MPITLVAPMSLALPEIVSPTIFPFHLNLARFGPRPETISFFAVALPETRYAPASGPSTAIVPVTALPVCLNVAAALIGTATRGPLACPSKAPVPAARAACAARPTTATASATSHGDFVVIIFISISSRPTLVTPGRFDPRDRRSLD